MCLLLLAIKSHPIYDLILAANRDEYYDRPTAPAGFWKDSPDLLAGRDLQDGGTWLGISRNGRIGAITNYRDPASRMDVAPSRGVLIRDFLQGAEKADFYVKKLAKEAAKFNGFNLVLKEKDSYYVYSNREDKIQRLGPGIYGLSNHLLNTPWPKVVWGKKALERLISNEKELSPEAVFRILRDRRMPDDDALPDTGVGLEWERVHSSIFTSSPTYGTRSSTVIFIDLNDRVTFIERTYNPGTDKSSTKTYEFKIKS